MHTHTCTQMYTHTCTHTRHSHTCTYTHTTHTTHHTCTPHDMCAHTHTCMHTCTHTHTTHTTHHTCTPHDVCAYTHTHAHMHTHTCTQMYTHICTHTRTHTLIPHIIHVRHMCMHTCTCMHTHTLYTSYMHTRHVHTQHICTPHMNAHTMHISTLAHVSMHTHTHTGTWTVDTLSGALEAQPSVIRRHLGFWVGQGVLKEHPTDTFTVVEEQQEGARGAGGSMSSLHPPSLFPFPPSLLPSRPSIHPPSFLLAHLFTLPTVCISSPFPSSLGLPLLALSPFHPPPLFPMHVIFHPIPLTGDLEDEEESVMASAKEQKESELQVTYNLIMLSVPW